MPHLMQLTQPFDPDKWKAYLLYTDEVAGVKHYDANKPDTALQEGDLLTLVYEPDNQYDPTAIAIFKGQAKLGYIFKSTKLLYAPLLLSGYPHIVKVLKVINPGLPDVHVFYNLYLITEFDSHLIDKPLVPLYKLYPEELTVEPGTQAVQVADTELADHLDYYRYHQDSLTIKRRDDLLWDLDKFTLPLINVSDHPKFHFGHFNFFGKNGFEPDGLTTKIVTSVHNCLNDFFEIGPHQMYETFQSSFETLQACKRQFAGDDLENFRYIVFRYLCHTFGKFGNWISFSTSLDVPDFGDAIFNFHPVIINDVFKFDLFDFDLHDSNWLGLRPVTYDLQDSFNFGRHNWMYIRFPDAKEMHYVPKWANQPLYEFLRDYEKGDIDMLEFSLNHQVFTRAIVKFSIMFAMLKKLFTPLELKFYFGHNISYQLSSAQYSTYNGVIDDRQFRLIKR